MTKTNRVTVLASFNMGFHWFIVGIIIPIMTLFLVERGLSLLQVGITFSIYSITVALLELPTGGLADTIGRKKVYIFSLLFQLLSALILILVRGYYGTVVCFIFQGVARSLSSGAMDAHFIDEFYKIDPDMDIQRPMSRIGMTIPITLALGSLLGGYLPMSLGEVTKNSLLNSVYAANYIGYLIAVILQIIFTLTLIREERTSIEDTGFIAGFKKLPEVLKTSIHYGIKHPVIFILSLMGFIWGFSISSLEQLWQPQLKSLIPDSNNTMIFGLLTTGYFAAAGLGNIIINPIASLFKKNYALILLLSNLLMGLLYLLLAFQNQVGLFSILYITLFMFNGVQNSPQSSIFNSIVPSEQRSTMLSFTSLFMQTGAILGSVFLGFIAHKFSIKVSWIIASSSIILSSFLYLKVMSEKK